MNKWKRTLATLFVCGAVLAFTGCGGVNVSFDIGDATLVSGETAGVYKENSPVTAPVIEREGYVFDGWDKDFSAPTEDIVVKPLWKKLYTVTFDAAGGEFAPGAETIQQVVDGEAATPPAVTRDKFDFVKWTGVLDNVHEDTTATAVWNRKVFSSTELFEMMNPATVEVKTYRKEGICYNMGSGFFIDENGTLLTNYHVIEEAKIFQVITDKGITYTAPTVLGYDKKLDIAILKVDTKGQKVPYLEIGTPKTAVGDKVYTLGSPLGLTGTFSDGIVSYVNRIVDDVSFIQITAPISAGNSGGPLVDANGYVIGINSASYTAGQNLNLAVSISQYDEVERREITAEEFFEETSELEIFFGENMFYELPPVSSTTGQILEDGATVSGKLSSSEDRDFYMTPLASDQGHAVLYMLRGGTESDLQALADYTFFFYTDTENAQEGYTFPTGYFYGVITEDPDGVYYLVMALIIPEGSSAQMKYVGMSVASDRAMEYELFTCAVTDLNSPLLP